MATWEEVGIDIDPHKRGQQKVKCPQCSDNRKNHRDKSLSVDAQTGLYNCHYCSWHGVVDGLTSDEKKQTWLEERKRERDHQKAMKKEYTKPKPPRKPDEQPPVGQKLQSWFSAERHITPETLAQFGIVETSESWPAGKDWVKRGTINFTYYRGGELINVKFRDGKKNFRLAKDAELILYNLDSLRGQTECIICEGEIDCMSWHQAGFTAVVSVPNGASKGSARLEYIDNCVRELEPMQKIILAADDDQAGAFLKSELTARLGAERCWFVTYPDDCKDANEVLIKHGSDRLRAMGETAHQPPIEQIIELDDVRAELDEIYRNGWPQTDPLGFTGFDQLLRFQPGQLTTITGIPGHGKGEFIDQITIRLASRFDWRIGVFSFEEPVTIKTIKLCQKFTGQPYYVPGSALRMTPTERDQAFSFLRDHYYFIDLESEAFTIDRILDKARELVKRYGIRALVIDPYNCIESTRPREMTESEYVGEVMGKMARFAKRHNVHIFFVAHPTKIEKDVNGRYKVPNLYSIAGSANFYNKTHNGLVVYRNPEDDTTTVFVQKVKFSFNGKIGSQSFKFDVASGCYTELHDPNGFVRELEYRQAAVGQAVLDFARTNPEPPGSTDGADGHPGANPLLRFPSTNVSHWASPLPPEDTPF